MQTERLYYNNSYLAEFDATVVAHGAVAGQPAVALDRSAFYPAGGGQPADGGRLNELPVVDAQSDEHGVVWHALKQPSELAQLPVGASVRGSIAWARRFDHMQQHCGQHMLTAAFVTACGLNTLAFHLSENSVTIDLDTPELSLEQARAAEALANEVVWACEPVLARFVDAVELAEIRLRKPPAVQGPVRVVSIGDFDHSACGGTHPRNSGGVGQIAVLRWARQRAGTRVEFVCGGRVLAALQRINGIAATAAAKLSVGVDELPVAAERLSAAQRATSKELAQAQSALDLVEAERLYAAAEQSGTARIVTALRPEQPLERLRALAQRVAEQPGGVALVAAGGARAQLVVACAPDSGCDARDILQAGVVLLDGRGGGNAQLAQGGGPRAEQLEAALAAMLEVVRAS